MSSNEEKGTLEKTGDSSTSSSSEPTKSGIVKWFNVLKGWGFITPDDGSQEVFVHQSVLKMPGFRSLDEGEHVEFRCKHTQRGMEATSVVGIKGQELKGSTVRPLGKKKFRRIRCFNCGQFGNHLAEKCRFGKMPKSCYHCKATDHLVADCPTRPQQHQEPRQKQSAASSTSQSRTAKEEKDIVATSASEETSETRTDAPQLSNHDGDRTTKSSQSATESS